MPLKLSLPFYVLTIFSLAISPAWTKTEPNSPLTKAELSQAKKGNSYARAGKGEKAQVAYQGAIDQAGSVEECLALVKQTEHYGSILVPVRRNCLNKALHLAKTEDDYFQIITSARGSQLYEITKEAIDSLIARANSKEELLTLAHKSQKLAMNDIAHIAMEKLYRQEEKSDDKLEFAKQAKLMAMEDLMRQAIKDILDQENDVHTLCSYTVAIEPLQQEDLQRKMLRKAVYQVKNVDDCKEVFDLAKRLGQQDIVELAAFKGKKMILINQARAEQEGLNEEEAAKRAEEERNARATQENKNNTPVQTGPGF